MKPGQLQPLCLPPSCFRAWSTSHEYEKKLCLYNDSYTVPPCDIKLMLVLVCFLLRKGLILKKKNTIRFLYHHTSNLQSYLTSYRYTLTFALVLWLFIYKDSEIFSCTYLYAVSTEMLAFSASSVIPLRERVKSRNSFLISITVPATLQKYCHVLWTSHREGDVLLSPNAVGCIWIIFVPNNIWMTIRRAWIENLP